MLKKLLDLSDYLFSYIYLETEFFKGFKIISSLYAKRDNQSPLEPMSIRNRGRNAIYVENSYIAITLTFRVKPLIENTKGKKGRSVEKHLESFLEELIKQFNLNTKLDIKNSKTSKSDYRFLFISKKGIEYFLTATPIDGRTGSKGFRCKLIKIIYIKKFF